MSEHLPPGGRLVGMRAREFLGLMSLVVGILLVPVVTAIYYHRGGLTNLQWQIAYAAGAACEFVALCFLLPERRTLLRTVGLSLAMAAGALLLAVVCVMWLGSMIFGGD